MDAPVEKQPIIYGRLSYSPSGRYAFRVLPYDQTGRQYGVVVFDFEKESVHDVYFKTSNTARTFTPYWVDEEHLGVVYTSRYLCLVFGLFGWQFGRTLNLKSEKIQLYKLDLTKKKHKPIKTRTLKDTTGDRIFSYHDSKDEYVTLDEKEYMFMTSFKHYDEPGDNSYRHVNLSCRFVPRKFDGEKELPVVRINLRKAMQAVDIDVSKNALINEVRSYALFRTIVRGSNVYLQHSYCSILKLDMQKYFNVLRRTSESPAYDDFCSKCPSDEQKRPLFWGVPKDGHYFSEDWCEQTQQKVTNLRDIQTGKVERTFVYDENYAISIHPSGYCVRYRNSIAYHRCPDMNKYYLEKENTFTKLNQFPEVMEGFQFKQADSKVPRFIREGRKQVTFSFDEEKAFDFFSLDFSIN